MVDKFPNKMSAAFHHFWPKQSRDYLQCLVRLKITEDETWIHHFARNSQLIELQLMNLFNSTKKNKIFICSGYILDYIFRRAIFLREIWSELALLIILTMVKKNCKKKYTMIFKTILHVSMQ